MNGRAGPVSSGIGPVAGPGGEVRHGPGGQPAGDGPYEPVHRQRAYEPGTVLTPRDLARQPRSMRTRSALAATAVALWCATIALLVLTSWQWAMCGAVPALALSLGLFTSWALARTIVGVNVHGVSMEPTYHDGDRVLVRRQPALVPGQVVVVEESTPDGDWLWPPLTGGAELGDVLRRRWIIKRVAAVPGDPVPRETVLALADVPEDSVPPGKLILLGDNAKASLDSRQSGYYPVERVLGAVWRPAAS
jgi:signal peptidase I